MFPWTSFHEHTRHTPSAMIPGSNRKRNTKARAPQIIVLRRVVRRPQWYTCVWKKKMLRDKRAKGPSGVWLRGTPQTNGLLNFFHPVLFVFCFPPACILSYREVACPMNRAREKRRLTNRIKNTFLCFDIAADVQKNMKISHRCA